MYAIGTTSIRRKKMINEQKLLILPFLEVAEMRLHSQSQWSICYLHLHMSCACSWTKYAQHNIIAKYFQALWDVKTFWGIGVGGVGPLFSKFKNRMQKVKNNNKKKAYHSWLVPAPSPNIATTSMITIIVMVIPR